MTGAYLAQAPFPDWNWLANPRTHERVLGYTLEHVELTVLAVIIGLAVAAPLAIAAAHWRWLYTPLLTVTGLLFTIPSIALFLLVGIAYDSYLGRSTALTGLAIYSLLILFRNTVAGLDSVPAEIREAGEALGHTSRQQLVRIEVPIALPVIIAGVRVATVTTIGLTTVTALVGQGGLGQLFVIGFNRQNPTILLVGVIGCALLALVADLALVHLQNRLLPWARQE